MNHKQVVQDILEKVADDFPWWSMPAHTMDIEISDQILSNNQPTMATDGVKLFAHPQYVENTARIDLNSTVLEELMHKVFLHPLRAKGKDHDTFNRAADTVINCLIGEQNHPDYHISDGVCYDPKYHGWTTEEVYNDMMKDNRERDKQGLPRPEPRPGAQVMPCPDDQADDLEMQIAVNEMVNAADAKRKAKADLQKAARGEHVPDLDAKAHQIGQASATLSKNIAPRSGSGDAGMILNKIVDSMAVYRKNWARPNKRTPFYMPSKRVDAVAKLVMLIDVSGSVSEKMVNTFAGFAQDVANYNKIDEIVIVQTDTTVKSVDVFRIGDTIELVRQGGGGTRFADAMDYVAAEHGDASLGVFLTDMAVSDFGAEPPFDMVWLNYGRRGSVAPYGETIDCVI
jgi:predicted metal-dependent peptidase